MFDHWQIMQGDPLDATSKVFQIVQDTRKRKGLAIEPFSLDKYLDKM